MKLKDKIQDEHKNTRRGFVMEEITRFKDRLKQAMKNESGNSFAKKCGMSEAVIRAYLQGKTYPSLDRLAVLAEKCEVSIEWLATGNEHVTTLERSEQQEPLNSFADEFALIPGYSIQVSAGHGAMASDTTQPSRHLAFRRKWLTYRGFNEDDLIVLWAKGDSMEPTVSNNDSIVVNRANTKPMDGHIYVMRHEDMLWVKRLQLQPCKWVLLSDNKAYPHIEVQKDEFNNFEIIGQVVHISKDVGL